MKINDEMKQLIIDFARHQMLEYGIETYHDLEYFNNEVEESLNTFIFNNYKHLY